MPESQAALIRKVQSSESETRALLHDCRRHIRATVWLAEIEAELRPERVTAHLAVKGRAILGRIDAATDVFPPDPLAIEPGPDEPHGVGTGDGDESTVF